MYYLLKKNPSDIKCTRSITKFKWFYFSQAHLSSMVILKKTMLLRGKSAIYWTIGRAFFSPNDIPLPSSGKFIIYSQQKPFAKQNDLSSIISLDFPQRLIILIIKKVMWFINSSNLYTSEIIQYILNFYLISAFLLY